MERPTTEFTRGIAEALRIIREEHDRLIQEHRATPGRFFGLRPSRRHYEIMGASNAIVDIGFKLLAAAEPR